MTGSPIRDFHRFSSDKEDDFDRLPECGICGDKVTDEFLYCINGDIICNSCLDSEYRVSLAEIMEV